MGGVHPVLPDLQGIWSMPMSAMVVIMTIMALRNQEDRERDESHRGRRMRSQGSVFRDLPRKILKKTWGCNIEREVLRGSSTSTQYTVIMMSMWGYDEGGCRMEREGGLRPTMWKLYGFILV